LKVDGAGGCTPDWSKTPSYTGPPVADLKKAKQAGTLSQYGIPDFSKTPEVKKPEVKKAEVKKPGLRNLKLRRRMKRRRTMIELS